MIKDLTSLKWKKNLYYISDGIIFDIESRKKPTDIDCCETYLIDITKLSEKDQKAKDGSTLDIAGYPEAFINNIPYICLEFKSADEQIIKRYFPLQYEVVEGDKVIEDKTIQNHPNIYDNKYVNKFNYEVFNYIKNIVKGKEPLSSKNIKLVKNSLPDWLLTTSEFMVEEYIDRYFLKGNHFNRAIESKMEAVGSILYKLDSVKLGVGDELSPINIWDNDVIINILIALQTESLINTFNQETKNAKSESISKESMEAIANIIKEAKTDDNPDSLLTLLNITDSEIKFESVSAPSNIDTYYEYLQWQEEEKKKLRKYYSCVKDEESWLANNEEGKGLFKYYEWSDRVNKPYKEDLWNTVEGRAANINDARKDPETGEYVLDENGNYIYDNCERCWMGAVKASGAKYPWIVVNFDDDVNSIVKFKYTYPDGTVKEVKPWNDKVFREGGWGCASVAAEFEDNDFLISENRKDGGESTFDFERFEIILDKQ